MCWLDSCWRVPSSGIWSRVRVDLAWTDVSEERIASIFKVEKFGDGEPAWAGGCRLQLPQILDILPRGGPNRKHRFLEMSLFYIGVFTSPLHWNDNSYIVEGTFISAGTCLPSRCLTMDVYSASTISAVRRHITILLRGSTWTTLHCI
jgi:hypothetical protein